MKNQNINLLVRNGYIPAGHKETRDEVNAQSFSFENSALATVISNIAYFGYVVSADVFAYLSKLTEDDLIKYWSTVEPVFSEMTGHNRNIGEHVLYKNFPSEVLGMQETEYWLRQFFVYMNFHYNAVRQKAKERPECSVFENGFKVLHAADEEVEKKIVANLVSKTSRWNDQQFSDAVVLVEDMGGYIRLSDFAFKENGLNIMKEIYSRVNSYEKQLSPGNLNDIPEYQKKYLSTNNVSNSVLDRFEITDATDVLRLASVLSESDVSLRGNVKFANFKRKDRKSLILKLEESKNLEEDVASRQELFKKLFAGIHPFDFKYKKVQAVCDDLYNGRLNSFNSRYEKLVSNSDSSAISLAATRPGFYLRDFHRLYALFGHKAIDAFSQIIDDFTTTQLVKFKGYVRTINNRSTLIYPPKGNWSKAVIEQNKKVKLPDEQIIRLIDDVLSKRTYALFPDGFDVSQGLREVKIQSNDQKLADYGRGTVFHIPDNINFIRTSTYWNSRSSSFLDNTWNFFDENWKSAGVCCWNFVNFKQASVFSGDAVNNKDGKAAQLIDLYIKDLIDNGVRYAVWSALSYSNIPFSNFDDAHAGMQMGENPENGQLFEPSRVNFSFPLKEDNLSKVIAYIDLLERKIIYVDINTNLNIRSGGANENVLSEKMPVFIEYMNSIPSIYDLLSTAKGEIPAMYSDEDFLYTEKHKGSQAYVFKRMNSESTFDFVHVDDLL